MKKFLNLFLLLTLLTTAYAGSGDTTFSKNLFIYGTIARAGSTNQDTFLFNTNYCDKFDTTSTVTNILYQSCGDYPLGSTRKTDIVVKRSAGSYCSRNNGTYTTLLVTSINSYVYPAPGVYMSLIIDKIHSVYKPKGSTVSTIFMASAVAGRADQYTTVSNIGNIFVPNSALNGLYYKFDYGVVFSSDTVGLGTASKDGKIVQFQKWLQLSHSLTDTTASLIIGSARSKGLSDSTFYVRCDTCTIKGNVVLPLGAGLGKFAKSDASGNLTWANGTTLPHVINTIATAHKDTLLVNYYNILDSANATVQFDTILFPASPANNDVVEVKTTKAITTVVYSGNGNTVVSQVALGVGTKAKWIFDTATSTWY